MNTPITPQSVRERAVAAHLPLSHLMAMAGIQNSTFWRWENNKGKPSALTLRKIADALDEAERLRVS